MRITLLHKSTAHIRATVNCGSFLNYGGYAARAAYRPPSDKMYKLILRSKGDKKQIQTVGFYL